MSSFLDGFFKNPSFKIAMFVCVEVLWPSHLNGVMSNVVSLLNHIFTEQT